MKLSDEELAADEGDGSTADLAERMSELRLRGAETVILTRASQPALLLDAEGLAEIAVPRFEIADHRGAGDSLTAGVVAGIARGETVREAVTLGAAAGALNVTRHGLGTGHRDAIEGLRDQVRLRVVDSAATPADGRVTPDDLAAMTTPEENRQGRKSP